MAMVYLRDHFNTLRPRQNGRHFADDTFNCIFFNENVWIPIKIPLKFVPKGPVSNIPALVQIMAWRRSGDKPLSGPMMVRLPTHICVTRPQWVKWHLGDFPWHYLQIITTLVTSQSSVQEMTWSTKPLTEPMLIQVYNAIQHHCVTMS